MKIITNFVIALFLSITMLGGCTKEGPSGRDGIDGRDGKDGRNGSSILTGLGVPEPNIGEIGDFFLDLSTADFYGPKKESGWGKPISLKGLKGEPGERGIQGERGTDGQNGTKILSGITPPENEQGNNGDFYLDLKTKTLYGPKNQDGWGSGISLVAQGNSSSDTESTNTGEAGTNANVGNGSDTSAEQPKTFSVNPTEVTLQNGASAQIQITSGNGDYRITQTPESLAIVGAVLSDDKTHITLTGKSQGNTQLTLTDTRNNENIVINITVLPISDIQDSDYQLDTTGEVLLRWRGNTQGKHIDMQSHPILSRVTRIGSRAFANQKLQSIVLPNGLKIIDSRAFFNSTELSSVVIPNGVTTIKNNAFFGCRNLTSVVIPNSVTSVEYAAFKGCSTLSSVTITSAITAIERGVFQDCSALTSVTIPDGVSSIKSSAFSGCSALTSITIPSGVTTIESWAFQNCTSLTTVTLQAQETTISEDSFENTTNLQHIYVPDNRLQWYRDNWNAYAEKIKTM